MTQKSQYWLAQTEGDEARLIRVLTRMVEYCLAQEQTTEPIDRATERRRTKGKAQSSPQLAGASGRASSSQVH